MFREECREELKDECTQECTETCEAEDRNGATLTSLKEQNWFYKRKQSEKSTLKNLLQSDPQRRLTEFILSASIYSRFAATINLFCQLL